MADTQSIMQLGIEAARAGNKAEARELFRLVTREDPNNAQSWLWLAGVAEDREEKRAALERVVQLEPGNDLARKGLAALGGAAAGGAATAALPTQPATPATPAAPAQPVQPMAGPASDQDIADAFDSIDDYAASPEGTRARVYQQPEQVGGYVPPDFGDEDYDLSEYQNRPRVTAADLEAQERGRETTVLIDDEEPRRRGLGAWLPALLILLLAAAALIFFIFFNDRNDGTPIAGTDPSGVPAASASSAPGASAEAGLGGTTPLTDTGVITDTTGAVPGASTDPNASPVPVDPNASPAPVDPNASPAPVDPNASPAPVDPNASPAPVDPNASPATGGETPPVPPVPPADVATANPAVVPNNQTVTAANFEFGFSGLSNVATGSYGGTTPTRGIYLIVLATVRNTGGEAQPIPDGFFVVKDAQGRVYDFNRAASVEYFNRYPGAGDYPAEASVPPNAALGSMPLLFDVAPDATNLVMFSRDNLGQGFLVRQAAR